MTDHQTTGAASPATAPAKVSEQSLYGFLDGMFDNLQRYPYESVEEMRGVLKQAAKRIFGHYLATPSPTGATVPGVLTDKRIDEIMELVEACIDMAYGTATDHRADAKMDATKDALKSVLLASAHREQA